jgi:3-dehydroquinate synthase
LLERPELYAPHLGSRRAAIITNRVVAPLYLDRVATAVRSTGAQVTPIVIEDGEAAKDWRTLETVFDQLLAARCGRDSVILALGGGVVGDLAGFAAAVYQRGIPFLQVPTTLLAQVDSSVGGKTAINHPRGKNMIGAFHQPVAVVSDIATLDSLAGRELAAGLAEVIKHGLILDASFTEWLEKNVDALRRREHQALAFAVRRSCELKAKVVAADERETGLRAILNFGHTFGHAIEAATGYGRWLHGEAVAAGMVMAAELSSRAGRLSAADVTRVRDLIKKAGLPIDGPAIPADQLLEWMRVDKKVGAGRMRFVLLSSIGAAQIRDDVDEHAILGVIRSCSAAS